MLWILGQLIWFCLMHRSYIYSGMRSLQKISVFWAALTGKYTQYLIQAPLISNTFETGQNLGKIKQSTGVF